MPTLPPGTVNDITVTTPAGLTGTLKNAWVVRLQRRRQRRRFFGSFVATLVANQITVGVGGGNYGFTENIKRQSDGRLPSQGQARHLLHAAALHRQSSPTCPARSQLRAVDRGASPPRGSPAAAEAATSARSIPCAATRWPSSCSRASTAPPTSRRACTGVFADVPCPGDLRRLDRAARRSRTSPAAAATVQLLPLEQQHPRPDGRVHRQDVQPSVASRGREDQDLEEGAPWRRGALQAIDSSRFRARRIAKCVLDFWSAPSSSGARRERLRGNLHRHDHDRLRRRVAAPGDPRRQREPRRRHDRLQHPRRRRAHDRAHDVAAERHRRPSRSTATRSPARRRTRCRSRREPTPS